MAYWAGVAAFFGSIASFELIDALTPGQWDQALASLLTALIVGGAVYSQQRLKDAQDERRRLEAEAERERERERELRRGTTYRPSDPGS